MNELNIRKAKAEEFEQFVDFYHSVTSTLQGGIYEGNKDNFSRNYDNFSESFSYGHMHHQR